ncbi:MAG: hypothetical protein H8E55_00125 [Pelagibacterales bacterium]|nr:hypothetical protein [Pelagibacterales bacterium]
MKQLSFYFPKNFNYKTNDNFLFEFKRNEDIEELVKRINKIPSISNQKDVSFTLIEIIGDRGALWVQHIIGLATSSEFDDLPQSIPPPLTEKRIAILPNSIASYDLHLFLYFIKKTNITLFKLIKRYYEKESKISGCRPNFSGCLSVLLIGFYTYFILYFH